MNRTNSLEIDQAVRLEKLLRKKRRRNSLEAKQRKYGYIFVAPFAVGAVLLVLLPLVMAVLYSLGDVVQEGNLLVVKNWSLDQYNELLFVKDNYRRDVLNSLSDTGINVLIVVIFSFFMASIMNAKFLGRGFARSVMFLPVIIASGVMIYLSSGDLMEELIKSGNRMQTDELSQMSISFADLLLDLNVDMKIIGFLVSAVERIGTITTMSAVSIVIFLAGLQSISPSIYEASYIEGATGWEVFWKISLPLVSPLILLSMVYTVIDSFTNPEHPVIIQIHNLIRDGGYGEASVRAVVYSFVVILVLAIVYFIVSRLVFYYD